MRLNHYNSKLLWYLTMTEMSVCFSHIMNTVYKLEVLYSDLKKQTWVCIGNLISFWGPWAQISMRKSCLYVCCPCLLNGESKAIA